MDERKALAEKLAQEIAQVTRECLIGETVYKSLETGGFSRAVDTVT